MTLGISSSAASCLLSNPSYVLFRDERILKQQHVFLELFEDFFDDNRFDPKRIRIHEELELSFCTSKTV